ncbi:MAG: GH39 family glycosyl hydrolase [Spirochaetota bacterium]
MRRLLRKATITMALLATALVVVGQVTVQVDPSRTGEQIDRTLFSLVNYQSVIDEAGSLAERAVLWLNMDGTYQRISTNPPGFEPTNDNASPSQKNWSGFFPDELFASVSRRYVGRELVERIREDGMEPVMLLAYNLPWLSPDGNVTFPPEDPDEWVEFVSAALQAVNGEPGSDDYELLVQYIEIWNEPDTEIYWKGTAQEYYDLFRKVAERINREHPEVKIGGPSALNYTSPWALNFVRAVGEHLDYYVYHSYNEDVDRLIARVRQVDEFIRQTTGRRIPIMITESDNFAVQGAQKMDYLIRRQIALQDVRDLVDGFHHFQARAYQEGQRFFGLVRNDGSVIDYNYYPYWLFRDLEGNEVELSISGGRSSTRDALLTIGSVSQEAVTSIVYLPSSERQGVRVTIETLVPQGLRDGLAMISKVAPAGSEVVAAELNEGAAQRRDSAELEPGSAVAVTVRAENPPELVWTDIEMDRSSGLVGQPLRARVRMINTSLGELRGSMQILGVPQDWEITVADGDDRFRDLAPGATHDVTFEMVPKSPTPVGGSGAYVFVNARPPRSRSVRMNSLAVNLNIEAPVQTVLQPDRLYATGGYEGTVYARLTNTFSERVQGQASLLLPADFESGDARSVTLGVGQSESLEFPVRVGAGASAGEYTGRVSFLYDGISFTEEFTIVVTEFDDNVESTTVDLSEFYNVDGVSFQDDFDDYDLDGFGGRFALPGELLPTPGRRNYLGVDFDFPDVANSAHLVETRGQEIPVTAGRYDRLAILTTTVNSDKSESITVVYSDGSTQVIEFNVTDWCVQPKNEELPIVRAQYRHMTEGVLRDCNPQIFFVDYELDGSKQVAAIRLPERPTLYIVAASLVRD